MKETRFKDTEVGRIPEDWSCIEIDSLTSLMTNGFVGTIKDQYVLKNEGILYIQGFNVEENSFNMTGVKYVSHSFHNHHKRSCLKEGDLLTVQTGDIGVTTCVPKEYEGANCQALIISRFLPKYDSRFWSYYFNSIKGRKSLLEIETGSTMKHINVKDMVKVLVPVPESKSEQTNIASSLTAIDKLISSLNKLIEKKKNIKQGTMQQLLTGKKRLKGFTEPWVEKQLGELLQYEQPTKYLVSSTEYSDNGIPVLTVGKTFILGYTNESKGIYSNLPVIIFDDFVTESKYVDFPFKAKSSAMKMLTLRDNNNNLRFVYEIMQMIDFPMTDHKRWWIGEYSHLVVKIPSIDEQKAIASVLTSMDNEISALEAKKAKYEAIKQGMMQQLLTGKIRLV